MLHSLLLLFQNDVTCAKLSLKWNTNFDF